MHISIPARPDRHWRCWHSNLDVCDVHFGCTPPFDAPFSYCLLATLKWGRRNVAEAAQIEHTGFFCPIRFLRYCRCVPHRGPLVVLFVRPNMHYLCQNHFGARAELILTTFVIFCFLHPFSGLLSMHGLLKTPCGTLCTIYRALSSLKRVWHSYGARTNDNRGCALFLKFPVSYAAHVACCSQTCKLRLVLLLERYTAASGARPLLRLFLARHSMLLILERVCGAILILECHCWVPAESAVGRPVLSKPPQLIQESRSRFIPFFLDVQKIGGSRPPELKARWR